MKDFINLQTYRFPKAPSLLEEKELFRRFYLGDMSARRELIYKNLKLILYVIKKYFWYSDNYLSKEDLFQEGYLILEHCVDLFDVSKGFKFSTYACNSLYNGLKRKINKEKRNSSIVFSELDKNSKDTNYALSKILVDKNAFIENFVTTIFSTSKINKLDYCTRKIIEMRFGLEGKTKTLNEIYEEVPFSHLQIFLIINRGLCELLGSQSDYNFLVTPKIIQTMFSQFKGERENTEPFNFMYYTKTLSPEMQQFYLRENLYEDFMKFLQLLSPLKCKYLAQINGLGFYDTHKKADITDSTMIKTSYIRLSDGLNHNYFSDSRSRTIYELKVFKDYSMEELDNVIYELDIDDIRKLVEVLGDNFEARIKLTGSIPELLKRKILNRLEAKRRNFYEQFNGCSKFLVDYIISTTMYKTKLGLFKVGGFYLKSFNFGLNNYVLSTIHKRIEVFKNSIQCGNNLLDIFGSIYSSREIKFAIRSLEEEPRNELLNYINNKLEIVILGEEVYEFIGLLGLKLRINRQQHNGKRVKTIYEIFSQFSHDQVDYVISTLNDDDSELLFKRYGFDLECPDIENWDDSLKEQFKVLIKKIKNRLLVVTGEKSKSKSLDEFFIDFTHLEIVIAISKLPDEYVTVLRNRFGQAFDNYFPEDISHDEMDLLYKLIMPKLETILNNMKYGKADRPKTVIYSYFSEVPKSLVNHAIRMLEESEIEIVLMRNGIDLDNPKSAPEWFIDNESKKRKYRTALKHIGDNVKYLLNTEFCPQEKERVISLLKN